MSLRTRLATYLERQWHEASPPLWARALERVYGALAPRGRPRPEPLPLPVVVVGNLTVGGTGKTPFVIWLVEALRDQGLRVGVISRGYGGRAGRGPRRVAVDDEAASVGDEPLLIARATGAPVVVGSDRRAAVEALTGEVDIVVSDDGLQNRQLARDLEIVIVDAERGWGNGHLLPAGPLRQPATRLDEADIVLRRGNGQDYEVEYGEIVNLTNGMNAPLASLADRPVVALAGIAQPDRFFAYLRRQGLAVECRAFADHHVYREAELQDLRNRRVITTEKDATKLAGLCGPDWWMLPIKARLAPDAAERILRACTALTGH